MKIISFLLLTFSVLSACSKAHMDTTVTANSAPAAVAPANDSISYLALGDSYTIGESVPLQQNFPNQLVISLRGNGFPKAAAPVIIARTGWRTDELIGSIQQANLNRKFDYVTLLIGVNNQFQHRSADVYRTEFVQLLQTAIAFANGNAKRVFVLSIPDWGVTPFASGYNRAQVAAEIDQFNAINKEETLKAGVNYTDITPISRQAATDTNLVAPDGLHPSVAMYGWWVHDLLPPVINSLK